MLRKIAFIFFAASVCTVSPTICLLNESFLDNSLGLNIKSSWFGSGVHGVGGVAFTVQLTHFSLKKLYGLWNCLAANSALSGTFLTCSNDVQIHCGRLAVLCTA